MLPYISDFILISYLRPVLLILKARDPVTVETIHITLYRYILYYVYLYNYLGAYRYDYTGTGVQTSDVQTYSVSYLYYTLL